MTTYSRTRHLPKPRGGLALLCSDRAYRVQEGDPVTHDATEFDGNTVLIILECNDYIFDANIGTTRHTCLQDCRTGYQACSQEFNKSTSSDVSHDFLTITSAGFVRRCFFFYGVTSSAAVSGTSAGGAAHHDIEDPRNYRPMHIEIEQHQVLRR